MFVLDNYNDVPFYNLDFTFEKKSNLTIHTQIRRTSFFFIREIGPSLTSVTFSQHIYPLLKCVCLE